MKYQEFQPGLFLKHFVKCYFFYESDSEATFDDTVFPSGCVEIIFNLGSGKWQTEHKGILLTNPAVELWGQIVKPLRIRSIGKNSMLGIRFFPHAAVCFLEDNVERFNDTVTDYSDISGSCVIELQNGLLESKTNAGKIELIEHFLNNKLSTNRERHSKMSMITSIMNEIGDRDFFDNIDNVASRHGITSRYLQKLFLQYTGLTPKLYSKINRFQNSLKRVSRKDASLTSIAYDCGYFDQSHFIRDFKSFTGYTPSVYSTETSPITFAFSGGKEIMNYELFRTS